MSEIKITIEDLKDKKLMIATPMYGGNCAGIFTKSTNDLCTASGKYGIDINFYYLFNESLITRARNYCVDEFLRSDCTHLLFIDSDIGFEYKDVYTLLHLCGPDMDVVTGPYPKKTISWEKVKMAADQGFGDKNPFELANFVGDFVFNPDEGITEFKLDSPVPIQEGGTGFMMIHRGVFEKYEETYPELKYLPDHVRTEHFDGTREIMAYFDTVIDPDSRRYLSEDYMFSYNVRKMGMKVYMCPWMQLRHVGSYIFGGSLSAMAQIGTSPTASKESNAKHYKRNKSKKKPYHKMVKKR
ncbi:MAG: hypothetical protein COA84_13350 [Robiginitomaculum sp.]|nr:MAG: hypothetical protein COA84_13350 [Robiginitomaculum sp.]